MKILKVKSSDGHVGRAKIACEKVNRMLSDVYGYISEHEGDVTNFDGDERKNVASMVAGIRNYIDKCSIALKNWEKLTK